MTPDLARTAPRLAAIPLASLSFVLLNALGLAAYLHPFVFAETAGRDPRWFEHSTDAPLIFGAIGALCMALVVVDLTDGRLNSKSLAALGVMAAFAAVLRTVTLPAGANLYWSFVILGAYAFGPRMGFLLGAFSMFLSAVVTGGIGPWLPFQMFGSAWIALAAGLAGRAASRSGLHGTRRELLLIAAFGGVAAVLYGLIINLWSWPFWVGGPDISYEPGIGAGEALRRYWNFYILVSFGWDLVGSVCNVVVLLTVGRPLLRALLRYRDRFTWTSG